MAEYDSTYNLPSIFDEDLPTPAGGNTFSTDPATAYLRDPTNQDVIAVAEERNNSLATEEFIADIDRLSYFQFSQKYGAEAAGSRFRIAEGRERYHRAQEKERSAGAAAGDAYVAAAMGLYRDLGNIGTLVYGELISDSEDPAFTAKLNKAHNENVDYILKEKLSPELQEKQYFEGIASKLDAKDNEIIAKKEVDDGSSEFMAGFRRVGRDVMDTFERAYDDPAIAGNLIAQGIGSVYSSMPLAGGGGLIAKGATAITTRNIVANRVAASLGAAAGAGVQEASGVYAEAVKDIMDINTNLLVEKSPIMKALIDEGLTPDEAKAQLAGTVAETVALRQLPVATVLGLLTSRFEAMPVGYFMDTGVTKGLLKIVGEGVEEFGQGLTGKINTNVAVEDMAKIGRSALEGAGNEAAMGFLAGVGVAGTVAAPTAVAGTPQAVRSAFDLPDPTGSFADRAASVVDPVTTGVNNLVNTASTSAVQAVNQATPEAKAEQTAETNTAREASFALESLTRDIAIDELPSELVPVLAQPDQTPAPESMADVSGGTNIENVYGILTRKNQNFDDSEAAYAATQLKVLEDTMPFLPEAAQEKIGRMLGSKRAQAIKAKVAKIDLNDNPVAPEAPLTDDEVASNVNMAKLNPANVDPVRVSKILQESGDLLTDEEIGFLETAQKIAETVNQHTDNKVEIETEQNVRLKSLGKATKGLSPKATTRSILAEGYKNRKGQDLRSVSQFASDIIQALQSPTQEILNEKGNSIPLAQIMQEFENLLEHLNNKVEALNTSYDQNYTSKKTGKLTGPSLPYRALVDATNFVEPENLRPNSRVYYHRDSPGSVATARAVENDLIAATEVYNTLVQEYGEVLGNRSTQTPTVLKRDEAPTEQTEQAQTPDETSDQREGVEESQQTSDQNKDAQQLLDRIKGIDQDLYDNLLEWFNDDPTAFQFFVEDNNLNKLKEYYEKFVDKGNSALEVPSAYRFGLQTAIDMGIKMTNDVAIYAMLITGQSPSAFPTKEWMQTKLTKFAPDFKVEQDTTEDSLIDNDDTPSAPEESAPVDSEVDYAQLGIEMLGQDAWNELIDYQIPNLTQLFDSVYENKDQFQDWLDETSFLQMSKMAKELRTPTAPEEVSDTEIAEVEETAPAVEETEESNVEDTDEESLIDEEDNDSTATESTSEPTPAEPTEDEQYLDSPTDVDESPAEPGRFDSLGAEFRGAFDADPNSTTPDTFKGFYDLLTGKVNQAILDNAKTLAPILAKKLNEKLNMKTKIEGKNATLREHLANPDSRIHSIYNRFGQLQLVDRNTGNYDLSMIAIATLALVDWLSTASPTDPGRLISALESEGITYIDLTEQQRKNLTYGIAPGRVKYQLGQQFMKLWGLQVNETTTDAQLDGITQGLAAEMLEALSEIPMFDGLPAFTLEKIDLLGNDKEKTTTTLLLNPDIIKQFRAELMESQKRGQARTVREALFKDERVQYSIGEPINQQGRHKNNTRQEKAALRKMEETPHYLDESKAASFMAFGREGLMAIMGYVPNVDENTVPNNAVRVSLLGKNTSIENEIDDALEMVDALLPDPSQGLYYPVETTKVGRHQYQGVNPQANKTVRALVTPTHETIDLTNNEKIDALWLAIAQAADLHKLEKKNHSDILATVQKDFHNKWGAVKDLLKANLETGESDSQALIDAVLDVEPDGIEPQVLAAIHTVAKLEIAQKNGDTTMDSSLSVELDGLTNGAANMMVNYGQGLIDAERFEHFNRIGLFLGQIKQSVNNFFLAGNQDLYEVDAANAQRSLLEALQDPNVSQDAKEYVEASRRFAAIFGNFKVHEDGTIEMTRNTAKNPMTKVNYGSGVLGVGKSIADDMLLEFYKKVITLPRGADLDLYMEYPGSLRDDLETLGLRIPNGVVDWASFEFTKSQIGQYREGIINTIGEVLTETTKDLMGEDVKAVNDLLVFSTNVQSQYLALKLNEMLLERANELVAEGKMRKHDKTGKPIMGDMPVKERQKIIRELQTLAPIFTSAEQVLAIDGFSPQTDADGSVLSSTINNNLNQKPVRPLPDNPGVKVIPYTIIGSGDAMMMNFIFGDPNAPSDVQGVFDGLDVPATKLKEYSQFVNEQVMKTWERNVLEMGVLNFEAFLDSVESDPLLQQAFDAIMEKNRSDNVQGTKPNQILKVLQDRLEKNKARKKVLTQIPLSVDQMGGSDNPYVRGTEPMSRIEINARIQRELDGRPEPAQQDVRIEVEETTLDAVLKGRRFTPDQKKVIEVIKSALSNTRVIYGTLDQINQWRAENLPDNGKIMNAPKGMYDAQNDIIFLSVRTNETLLHEMVHAATFSRVLAHYEGTTNDAVTRLETLMQEFLDLESDGTQINEAKAAILKHLAKTDPFSKAAALNEFMAYGLANGQIRKRLKSEKTSLVQKISRQIIQLMRKMMGGIPESMFDHLTFNTEILIQPPLDQAPETPPVDQEGNGSNGNIPPNTPTGDLTPPANNFTNYWIKLLKDYLQDIPALDSRRRKQTEAAQNAYQIIDDLRQVGLLSNEDARKTFRAIYGVINSELKLDSASLIGLSKLFDHIEDSLAPEMFGTGPEAGQTYSAVLNAFGKEKAGIVNAVAVLLALSQTSQKFRQALEQVPEPSGEAQINGSLNSFLSRTMAALMSKITGTLSLKGENAQAILDELAETVVDHDKDTEFKILRKITQSATAADQYVSGKLGEFGDFVHAKNEEVQANSRSRFVKFLSGVVTHGTNLLNKETAELTGDALKRVSHMGTPISALIPVRELISEFIGSDRTNTNTVGMLDKVNAGVAGMRQAYREDLPGILSKLFQTAPNPDQWKAMLNTLGKTDFAKIVKPNSFRASLRLLTDDATRTQAIFNLESRLQNKLLPYIYQDALEKSQQLADYLNGKGAGVNLVRNAYAIARGLDGDFDSSLVPIIDELVSLYALNQMDNDMRNEVIQMYQTDPEALEGIITYMQGLNQEEDAKVVTEAAKLNGYKGYIPNHSAVNARIIVAPASDQHRLKERGYTMLKPFEGEEGSIFPKAYFFTTTRQNGQYSQGVMQNVASTYRGVDATTGVSINQDTSGYISDASTVNSLVQTYNQAGYTPPNSKETLIPVLDWDHHNDKMIVTGFERAINPDLIESHMGRDENMALMMGAWAGRQVEERLASEYNKQLVDELFNLWDNRPQEDTGLFEDLKTTEDPIYAESFRLIPQEIKDYIDQKFGSDGFMVRKDMINLSVGYREASVMDLWTGKSRLPNSLRKVMAGMTQILLQRNAFKNLANFEEFVQGSISTAKDIIVIRSLVVPAANLQANAVQLATRGVPVKTMYKSFRSKLEEVSRYNQNVTRRIQLEQQKKLYSNNPQKVSQIEAKIQAIDELNAKMSIAPMIAAGAYKQLSEGITDLDIAITSGKFAEYIENLSNKLPDQLGGIVKLGLVSKTTKLYQAANRATQYGDFLGKSIYYDHLLSQGLTEQEALKKMNEEFVNFSFLPGRTRSYLESMGMSWFMAFKIRIAKIAFQQMRENPLRAMLVNGAIDVGSPIQDNIFTVIAEDGRFDFATGYEMFFESAELNPWVNLVNG